MVKITFIGAGSLVFTRNLCRDILLTPVLQDCVICLMDIDASRLKQSATAVRGLIEQSGHPVQLEATLDQREAIRGASYVITTFQQGGLEAYRLDIEIPQKYGVEQCVGDTLGPGGVFRALRTAPVLLNICRDMDELAPDALLLNYVNPMAPNCWLIDRATGRPHVGLCHSVQGTSEMLARWIDLPYEEIAFQCAGINHQAFFLSFERGGEDLYPLIWSASDRPEVYGEEPVRIEIMRHFGYFVTESSGHASEYMPYFRRTPQQIEAELVPAFTDPRNDWYDFGRTGGYLRHCLKRLDEIESGRWQPAAALAAGRSHEYSSHIIEALETNRPVIINGNVPNRGLIANLPADCCVELPCLVDANGIQPTRIDHYPPQLAALNRTNINVQELIVTAALTGATDAVYHAVMLDPLTAAVCTLPQIHNMVTELLAAQAAWLPQFQKGES